MGGLNTFGSELSFRRVTWHNFLENFGGLWRTVTNHPTIAVSLQV